jgi:hypothetical protein
MLGGYFEAWAAGTWECREGRLKKTKGELQWTLEYGGFLKYGKFIDGFSIMNHKFGGTPIYATPFTADLTCFKPVNGCHPWDDARCSCECGDLEKGWCCWVGVLPTRSYVMLCDAMLRCVVLCSYVMYMLVYCWILLVYKLEIKQQ